MDRSNLSPEINTFIQTAEGNNGFSLGDLPENSLFEIHTQNSVYMIVVLDPKRNAIALTGTSPYFHEPDMYSFRGSTGSMHSSVLKPGWVGIGLHFQMQSITGNIITTTALKTFVMHNDLEKAQRIREKAEARRPGALTPATQEELDQWQADFDAKIEADFAGEYLTRIQSFLDQFNIHGKCYAASFFSAAKDTGKIQEALEVMSSHFNSHWVYKPPEIRGDIITPSDQQQWYFAYMETGLPVPK